MKTIGLMIAIVSTLSACATSKPIQGPNGAAHSIRCGSAVIDKCYEEAAKVCPNGYSFVDRQTNTNGMIVPLGNSLLMTRGPNSMLVECKA